MEGNLLKGLSPQDVEQIEALGRRRRFARREVVWHEGDRADTAHLIHSGRIAVRGMTSLGDVVTVAVCGPGDAAGMIDGHTSNPFHTTTAVALEATETSAIRIDDLNEARRRLPALNDAMIRMIADRTIDLVEQLTEAMYVPEI